MATDSFPAEGTDGFDVAQWADYFDANDGIINDYTGTSLGLTRISSGDIARYSPGEVLVAGYVLRVTSNTDLVVGTAAGTYWTWASYDPTLNVAGGGGAAAAAGPCRLGISTGAPDTGGGKQYVLLDRITRPASTALTATSVTVESFRRWVGPNLYMPAMPAPALTTPETAVVGFTYPAGTTIRTDLGNYQHRPQPSGGLGWTTPFTSFAFPATSEFVAVDAPALVVAEANRVALQGTLKRATGSNLSNGSNVALGTLPVGYRPKNVKRFICYGNGAGTSQVIAPVKVENTGLVTMYDPPNAVVFIDLSAINFSIGA